MTASSKSTLRERFAERYGIANDEVFDILKATAFRQRQAKGGDDETPAKPVLVSDAELQALLIICEQYGLNPFTKEIYAYPDKQGGGIVPVVSVDGWARIINEQPQYDGVQFAYSDELITLPYAKDQMHAWIEATIWRKDRNHPMVVREYAIECYREPFVKESKYQGGKPWVVNTPWQTHPRRMLRHKGLIQCARLAFGFASLKDQDEAERIIEMGQAVEVGAEGDQGDGSLMPRALENNPTQTAAEFFGGAGNVETIRELVPREKAAPADAEPVERKRRTAKAVKAEQAATASTSAPESAPVQNASNGQPGMFDEDGSADAGASATPPSVPVPPNMLAILQRKMSTAGRNEVDMKAHFGFGLSGVTKANFADVQAWATAI
ncbi:phage recombination protein Bet [Paraburkholderia sp. BR10936]|uniref:phage recombination protein Bet n=1 Tax=Paraburkholderia sp. BR10936 TaxID=3236993 RepID=UPI0034D29FF5